MWMKRCRVISPHKATYVDPIAMNEGDAVSPGRTDPENPGWIWCTSDAGKSGWVPLAYLTIDGDRAVAQRNYDAMELTTETGSDVTVVLEESGWALCETKSGKRGWVPINCLEPATSL